MYVYTIYYILAQWAQSRHWINEMFYLHIVCVFGEWRLTTTYITRFQQVLFLFKKFLDPGFTKRNWNTYKYFLLTYYDKEKIIGAKCVLAQDRSSDQYTACMSQIGVCSMYA